MQNPRLAARYAKSIMDLGIERGQLEDVFADMQYLQTILASSRELVVLLKSPVVKADKKQAILDAVTNGRISDLVAGFNRLLISKAREGVLPEIVKSFMELYNALKGIHKVKLTTAQNLGEDTKNVILAKIKLNTPMENVELETAVDEKLIGGFVLEYNNNLVDASILRDLQDIRKQFMNNDFIMKIR